MFNPGVVLEHRIAAFDLDGTLVCEKQKLMDQVADGLKVLREHKVQPMIVTGRSLDSFLSLDLPPEVLANFHRQVLVSNGDVVYDRLNGQIKLVNTLTQNDFQAFYDAYSPYSDIIVEMEGVHYAESKEAVLKYSTIFKTKRSFMKVVSISTLEWKELTEIVLFPRKGLNGSWREGVSYPGARVALLPFYGAITLVPQGSCKAEGLRRVLSEEGLGLEHTVAFGDGKNDISMLSQCRTGIAVRNSLAEVLASATFHLQEDIGTFLVSLRHHTKTQTQLEV